MSHRGQVRVLEEKLLPGIEDVGLDAKLITQVGNGSPFEEMTLEHGHLLGDGQMTTRLLRHG